MRSERAGPIAGVVLAAGSSVRMGRNKLLLELEGETVIRRAVSRAIAADLDPVVVVLGFDLERTKEGLSGLQYQAVINAEPARGINHSVRLGIEAVPQDACAAVVLLADMPFVTSDMIDALVRRYRESGAPLVISRYGDINAPPMLHDRSLFAEFQGPDGEGCGRHIVRRHRGEAVEVEWPASALADIDAPNDYDSVRSRLGAN